MIIKIQRERDSKKRDMNPAIQLWLTIGAILLSMLSNGCISVDQRLLKAATIASLGNREIVHVEHVDRSEAPAWKRMWVKPDPPTERTALLLRRFNLNGVYEQRPDDVIRWLHELVQQQPRMEEVHALAELAEKQARWSRLTGDSERATRLYATAIIHAYRFLFDEDLNLERNAYDPQFRSICDVYNRSLEGLLRDISAHEGFGHEYQTRIGEAGDRGIELVVKLEGRWRDQEFERFELVNDYQTEGFKNQHHTYGLGAPLIAVRRKQEVHQTFEKYYPPSLTLPMTAFLHLDGGVKGRRPRTAILSLYDPLEQTLIKTDRKLVPLESDVTTPLAYSLKDPLLNKGVLATGSLLSANFAPETYGMFMLEPYDPSKIPVVMVHGIWSSPTTWAHMFNDLRANTDLHKNYQFWFYSYPTAQPFWISAKQMRADLARIRRELDPQRSTATLDQMILVGHSMGGLVSTMQVMESEDHFWNLVSDQPFETMKGGQATISELRETFFFEPNPSIARVITIATPFRGSNFANSATRWLGQKLITLPDLVTNDFEKFARDNSKAIEDASFLTTNTSVDALSPANPVFRALEKASRRDGLVTHNIIGRIEKRNFFGSDRGADDGSDGVVNVASARLASAKTEILVPDEHQKLHQHSACILEVSRILIENLADQDRVEARPWPTINVPQQQLP